MAIEEGLAVFSALLLIGLLFYRIYKLSIVIKNKNEKESAIMPFIYFGVATIFSALLFVISILNYDKNIFLILNLLNVMLGGLHFIIFIVELFYIMLIPLGESHYKPN